MKFCAKGKTDQNVMKTCVGHKKMKAAQNHTAGLEIAGVVIHKHNGYKNKQQLNV